MKSLKSVCLVSSCAVWLLVSGCSSKSAPNYTLKDSVPDLDAEAARLRQMQMVRVVKQTDDPNDPENGKAYEWDDRQTASAISYGCPGSSGSSTTSECASILGRARDWYCAGELSLALASGAQDIVLTQNEEGVTYKVPPQSAATTANLAAGAVDYFQAGIQSLTPILSGVLDSTGHGCLASNMLVPEAEETAGLFIDSYQKAKKAYELLSSTTLSVADAQLASSPNFQTGQARSMAGRELSRAALAHFLVGGHEGLAGSTSRAMCSRGRLSGPAKRALDIIRESGISPADVLKDDSTLSIAKLINGSTTGTAALVDVSVRQRLEDAWGTQFPASQTVEDFYGLKTADFLAARAYLQDEIQAFSRSTTAQLPKRKFAGGRMETHARFSGITAPPMELPAAYWMAIALSEGTVGTNPTTYYGGDTVQQPTSWALPRGSAAALPGDLAFSLSTLADYTKSWAAFAAARPALQSFFTPELVRPLLTLADGSDVQGRVTHCYNVDEPTAHTYTVYGFKPTDGIAVVSGEDDLRCAVYGTVEGASCSLTGSSLVELTDPVSARAEFPDGVTAGVTRSGSLLQRVYVLKARGGITNPKAGDYLPLAGFVPYYSNSSWNPGDTICREFPIVPEALEGTAKALAASRQSCGESSTMCDGSRFDDRIPLEDELTDDGDGVESSWKHYLALARDAATESDALGKEYVDASLNKAVRAETVSLRQIDQQQRAAAELDKLQQICGTAVSPERLLAAMVQATDGSYDLKNWVTMPCANGQDPPEPTGWKCYAGSWIRTWARIADDLKDKDPEIAKLQKCIRSADDTKPYVHLGDAPLCLSTDKVQVAKKECGAAGACEDTGATCVAKADGLQLFSTRSVMPEPPGASLCDGLRELRKNPAPKAGDVMWLFQISEEETAARALLSDTFLNTGNIRAVGKALDVHLDYNDYVSISASGAKFTTGSTGQPNTSTWPCASAGSAKNCTSGTGLFCAVANCSDPASRGGMVRRLYAAGLAAKLITWTAGDPKPTIDVPVWIDEDLNPTHAITDTTGVRVDGVPIEVWTNARWRAFYANSSLPNVLRATSVSTEGANYLPIRKQFSGTEYRGIPDWTYTEAYTFAIGREALQPKDLLSAYWSGIGGNPGEDGYFAKVFFGQSHAQAKPAGAESMVMPGRKPVPDFFVSDWWLQMPFGHEQASIDWKKFFDDDLSLWPQKIQPPNVALLYTRNEFAGNDQWTDEKGQVWFTKHGEMYPVLSPTASDPPWDAERWSYKYDQESVLDGLELLCETGLRMSGQARASCGANDVPPQLGTLSDLGSMGSYLQCLGDNMRQRAASATFTDFPSSIVQELQSSTQGAFQTASGSMADLISQLRIALTDVAQSGPTIAREVQGFGQDLKSLQAAMTIVDTTKQMNDVHFEATTMQQITNCATEYAHNTGFASITSFAAMASVATCANSFAQIGFAEKLRSLGNEQNAAQRETSIADFNRRFTDHATALQRESLRLSAALETVRRVLGEIESDRQAARRSIESAMWLLSKQASDTPAINNAMGALSETARTRYVRAFSNAKRMAFLAKRAIEQRLGLSLNEMTEELPLVDAPAHWASTVCDTSGIDYASIADGTTKNFADSFIGDYVKKLENVVESYRLKHNFHEGRDTAVVSLRDDVMNVRANCSVTSPNLLLYASNLEHVDPVSPSTKAGWKLSGCEVDSNGVALPNCVTMTRDSYIPLRVRPFEQAPILGYSVAFGNAGTCTAPTCGWKAGAALSQTVDLTPGTYRLSWYTRDSFGIGGADLAAVSVVDNSGNELTRSTPTCAGGFGASNGCFIPANSDTWTRVYFIFSVAESGSVTVGFKHPSWLTSMSSLAAPMLERVDDPTFRSSSPEPKVFSDTTDQRTQTLPVCEDTSGALFRGLWTRGCERVCPDGFASDCRERAQLHCYRQTSFNLSQRAAETGQLFKAAGFALGNFNYRLESVGLNFVGTGLRNCADSNLPTTCNAAGFMPYTLIHDGPYFVRNYQGEDFLANLFAGHIEHARGLATERYLTNPISSSDHGLLEPYLRAEFRGRPLDGTFTLRVWDEDSAVFDAVQDVQLAISYRYWTRSN